MIRFKAYFLIVGLILSSIPSLALAESYGLPEPLVGQAQLTTPDGAKNWFGIAGNEAVFNHDPNFLLGFNPSNLLLCNGIADLRDVAVPGFTFCFLPDKTSAVAIMNSRTSLNGAEGLEIATLFWPPNSIHGDAYSTGNYLDNFAFYGNNLNKSAAETLYGSYYSWGVKNYEFNKEAQSYYDSSSSGYYRTRIGQLLSEASDDLSNAVLNSNQWYLQGRDADKFNLDNDGVSAAPEGKIWKSNRALTINTNKNITYRGKGTVIINGNLTIQSGTKIQPQDASKDALGFIVFGDVTIQGNTTIVAPIFATGKITINGNNVNLQGSYVATNFEAEGRTGVRFSYDHRLDSSWPPGFRYFNMPTAKNSAR